MNIAVLDVESKTIVSDWEKPWEAGISCVGVWTSWGAGRWGKHRMFGEHYLTDLAECLRIADVVVTYNGCRYDLRCIEGVWGGKLQLQAHCDLMIEIERSVGGRRSLESMARATLGRGKSGHGDQAPDMFQRGDWQKLATYNLDDVDLTRDLFYYAQTHGLLWCLCRESGVRYPTPITVPGGVQWTAPVKGAGR